MAKMATDVVVRDVLFKLKAQLISHGIYRYQNTSYITLQYHAHENGPLVYVTFKTKKVCQGSHAHYGDLSGMGKYITVRNLGNPYVFNRNAFSPNVTTTTKQAAPASNQAIP